MVLEYWLSQPEFHSSSLLPKHHLTVFCLSPSNGSGEKHQGIILNTATGILQCSPHTVWSLGVKIMDQVVSGLEIDTHSMYSYVAVGSKAISD